MYKGNEIQSGTHLGVCFRDFSCVYTERELDIGRNEKSLGHLPSVGSPTSHLSPCSSARCCRGEIIWEHLASVGIIEIVNHDLLLRRVRPVESKNRWIDTRLVSWRWMDTEETSLEKLNYPCAFLGHPYQCHSLANGYIEIPDCANYPSVCGNQDTATLHRVLLCVLEEVLPRSYTTEVLLQRWLDMEKETDNGNTSVCVPGQSSFMPRFGN